MIHTFKITCLVILFFSVSCKKITNETEIPIQDPNLKMLLEKGFKESDIISKGDYFIIQ